MKPYHTAIIGAGSGGITAAVGLAGLGKQVVLIEKLHVGGDCTNVGCVPSKLLIHLANHMQEEKLSPADILAKVREKRDHLRDEETEWMQNAANIDLKMTEAKFLDPNTLELSNPDGSTEQIKADNIIISTGSRAVKFPVEGLPAEKLLTNESLFDLEALPEHLAIVGAGVIGVEMAFAFSKLGAKVTLIDLAPRVLSVLEPEVSEVIHERLAAAGVTVIVGAKGTHFDDASETLFLDENGKELKVEGVSQVLLAVGRIPNLDLDMEKAGVEFTKRGIPTNNVGQTNISHIYAIGDVNLNSAFTHSANAQGRRLVQKIAFPFLPSGKEPIYPSATFSSPEVAQVGPTLAQLQQKFPKQLIKTYRIDLKDTDRGYTSFLEHGFVLIHAMALTGRVLSASIVAPSAGEMIPILTHAANGGPSMYKLANLVFPYPTLAEGIKKAASNYVFATLPKLPQEALTYVLNRWRKVETADA